jgi:hypothetical protein
MQFLLKTTGVNHSLSMEVWEAPHLSFISLPTNMPMERKSFISNFTGLLHIRKTTQSCSPKETLDYLTSVSQSAADKANLTWFPEVTIPYFTEHKRKDQIYQAQPCFQKDRAWFNWAYFHFGYESGDDLQEIAGQICYLWTLPSLSWLVMVTLMKESLIFGLSFLDGWMTLKRWI